MDVTRLTQPVYFEMNLKNLPALPVETAQNLSAAVQFASLFSSLRWWRPSWRV